MVAELSRSHSGPLTAMYVREALRTAQYDVTVSRIDTITDTVRNADRPSVQPSNPYSLDVSQRQFERIEKPGHLTRDEFKQPGKSPLRAGRCSNR